VKSLAYREKMHRFGTNVEKNKRGQLANPEMPENDCTCVCVFMPVNCNYSKFC